MHLKLTRESVKTSMGDMKPRCICRSVRVLISSVRGRDIQSTKASIEACVTAYLETPFEFKAGVTKCELYGEKYHHNKNKDLISKPFHSNK